jgi:circadian clock protein KaiC
MSHSGTIPYVETLPTRALVLMPTRSRASRTRSRKTARPSRAPLQKVATGIQGFDEITGGGLPKGRPTLVCGGPGSGKTLFAFQFLAAGAAAGESGVFVTFEETENDLEQNVRSLGHELSDLIARKLLAVEYVRVERSEIEETGEYDLEALFIRLDHALRSVGARRIVLDTIESLFAGLENQGVLRAELRRLFSWLKERGITAVITGERGTDTLTLDSPRAHREVSGLRSWHQRVSVSHRFSWHCRPPDHVPAAGS